MSNNTKKADPIEDQIPLSFGAKPSPFDYRTVNARTLATADLPPSKGKIDLNFDYVNDLCDQKKLGICTKCASRMAEEEFHRDGVRLSEYWGYLIGKTLIDDVVYGTHFEGSSAFTMLKAANKYGTPTKAIEKKFPLKTNGTYDEFIADFKNKYGGKIPDEVLEDAKAHKIPGYYRVDVDPVALAKEISAGRIIIFRIEVGKNFYTDKNGKYSRKAEDLLPLRAPLQGVISGHLMAMNEYKGLDKNQLLSGPNSWSKNWADNGYYNFVFGVQAPAYFTEAWAITDLPPTVIEKVKDLPEAQNFKHNFKKDLERGDSGDEVRALQIALSILGLLDIQISELGSYGPKTAVAVLKYQKLRALLPVNDLNQLAGKYVHKLTRAALNKDFNK